MDLRKFYLDNVNADEYYYKFHDLIEKVNYTYNVFTGEEETKNYNFDVFDVEEAIEKFKSLCRPENENHNKENQCWFYVILFYLYKNGYFIEEFPRVIERPPLETYDFVNKAIRNKLISDGKDDNGTVRYAERRTFVKSLSFKQASNHSVELNDAIEQKFKLISTRQASFDKMGTDEKIAEIANLIEYYLKKDSKFIKLDYSKICFEYINEDTIKNYRKRIQCFRHSSTESINERASFLEIQKNFMIDYGLTILKVIYYLVNE